MFTTAPTPEYLAMSNKQNQSKRGRNAVARAGERAQGGGAEVDLVRPVADACVGTDHQHAVGERRVAGVGAGARDGHGAGTERLEALRAGDDRVNGGGGVGGAERAIARRRRPAQRDDPSGQGVIRAGAEDKPGGGDAADDRERAVAERE